MKILQNTPILWALTGLLAACGSQTSTAPATANQTPELTLKLADGTALSTLSYFSANQQLKISASDINGSITKIRWVIDAGKPNERSGEYTGAEVKGNLDLTLPNLASGDHTLSVTATDNLGGTGSASGSFKVDAEAPVLNAVTVNGKAVTDGQALTFTVGDAVTLTAAATDTRGGGDTSGSPTVTLVYVGSSLVRSVSTGESVDLAALLSSATGVSTVRVVTADSALNTSASRTFTVQFAPAAGTGTGGNTAEPALSWLAPTGDYVSGNGTVTLRASALKAGKDLSTQVTYTATCGVITGSSWKLDASCSDGSKQTLTANLVDNGKNYTISKTVTVDASDPTVQITGPQQGQSVTANPVNVTFVATDSGSGIDHVDVMATDANGVKQMVGTVASASGGVIWAPQNGVYTLSATAYDKVGRTVSTSLGSVRVQLTSTDNQAPSVTAVNLPSGPQRRTIAVGITVSDPSPSSGIAKVELFEGGTSLGVQTGGVNGTYTFSLDTTKLSDGAHTLRAVVTDNVGLLGEKTGALNTDNTAPVVSWQNPRDGQIVKGTVILNATTSEGVVVYNVDGVTVPAGAQVLSDGNHTLSATATDAAGNATTSSVSVTADGTAPSVNVISPAEGASLTVNPVSIQVSASDALSGVDRIEVKEGATLLGNVTGGQGSVTYAFGNGQHALTITAYDKAGNTNSATRNITVTTSSTITPGKPSAAPSSAGNTSGTDPQFIRGIGAITGSASSTVSLTSAQLLVDGLNSGTPSASTGSASFNFDFTTLSDGLHDLGLRWQDSAGTFTDSPKLSIYVDKTAPTIVWNRPVSGSAISGQLTLDTAINDTGVGYDPAGIQYFLDGSTNVLIDADSNTPGFQFNSSGIVPGSHTLTAVAIDRLGNRTQQSVTVTTTTVPKVSISNAGALQDGSADNGVADGQLSGNISVKVEASDQSGVKQVDLFANDVKLATLTTSPYTFALDTSNYPNGNVVLFARATNTTGQTFDTANVTIKTQNQVAPLLSISNPSNGQLVATPNLPVQITISKRNSSFDIQNGADAAGTLVPNAVTVDLLDYRGQKVDSKTFGVDANNSTVQDNVDGVYVTVPFDLSRLPADIYTLRATAKVTLDGGNQIVPITNSIQITTRNQSSNPPAAVIRTPVQLQNVAVRNADGTIHQPLPTDKLPILNRDSALVINASDDVNLKYVQVRVVNEDGTPTNAYFLNQLLNIPGPVDLLVPTIDLDGSQYVADNDKNAAGQYLNAYLLRITTEDSDSNRNIQEVWVRVDRSQRQTYSAGSAAFSDHKNNATGQLTHQGATWGFNCAGFTAEDPNDKNSVETLNGCLPLANTSRIVAISSKNGVVIGTDVFPQVSGGISSAVNLNLGFATEGTYSVDWIVEDLTTGLVQRYKGVSKAVTKNP